MKKTTLSFALAGALGLHINGYANPAVEISGLMELVGSSGKDISDIKLTTLEVGLAAQVNEKVSAGFLLLHEEGENDFSVDTATVSLAMTDNLSLTTGKTYLPFGVFGSYMISDPLTLELAETNATTVQTNFTTGPLSASLYTFNGINAKEEIDNWGANLAYSNEHLLVTLGYLANMGDTDAIAADIIDTEVPGMSISAGINAGHLSLIGEYIRALDAFQSGDGNIDYQFTAEAQPSASNIELSYAMGTTILAVGMQNTDEAEVLGLPKKRLLTTLSHKLMENTNIAIELSRDEDYAGEQDNALTAQLAIKF